MLNIRRIRIKFFFITYLTRELPLNYTIIRIKFFDHLFYFLF